MRLPRTSGRGAASSSPATSIGPLEPRAESRGEDPLNGSAKRLRMGTAKHAAAQPVKVCPGTANAARSSQAQAAAAVRRAAALVANTTAGGVGRIAHGARCRLTLRPLEMGCSAALRTLHGGNRRPGGWCGGREDRWFGLPRTTPLRRHRSAEIQGDSDLDASIAVLLLSKPCAQPAAPRTAATCQLSSTNFRPAWTSESAT